LLSRGGHVRAHLLFVVTKFVVEAEDRDAPFVFHRRVDVDVILVASENLAKPTHADERAGIVADLLLVGGAEAWSLSCVPRHHLRAGATFEAVSTNEVGVL